MLKNFKEVIAAILPMTVLIVILTFWSVWDLLSGS